MLSVFHVPSFKSIIKVSEAQDAKSHHPPCPLPLPWLLHLVSDQAPSMCSLSSLHSPLVGFSLSPLLPTLVSYLLPLPLLLPPHSMQTTLDTIFLSTVLITLPLCSRTDHTSPLSFPPNQPQVTCLALESCHNVAETYIPTHYPLLPCKAAGLQPNHVTPIP